MSTKREKTWDEKYKPSTINEVFGQPQISAKVNNWIKRGRIPHLLFIGPPGVGKTSLARAIAKQLFGAQWEYNLHEYNASSIHGIDFVRNTIQDLVIVKPVGVSFQIIFLDEADKLTEDAQTALRQVMMQYTATTKFILSCNYPHKIIEPIKDRCSELRFSHLTPQVIKDRLMYVCKNEEIKYDDGTLDLISEHSRGSLRKAIQSLESLVDVNNHLGIALVKSDYESIAIGDARLLIERAIANDIEGYELLLTQLYYKGGFRADELLDKMRREIDIMSFTPQVRMWLIAHLAEYDMRIALGTNELLQMRCCLGMIHGIVNKYDVNRR
jgi:replication factor C small subunit